MDFRAEATDRNGSVVPFDAFRNRPYTWRRPREDVGSPRRRGYRGSGQPVTTVPRSFVDLEGNRNAYRELTDRHKRPTPHQENGRPKSYTVDLAAVRLVDFLNQDNERRRARHGLQLVVDDTRSNMMTVELPYRIFGTLDRYFFMSKLGRDVCLNWSEDIDSVHTPGQTHAPGTLMIGHSEVPRIAIEMNINFFRDRLDRLENRAMTANEALQRASEEFVVMLIHQMVHAYFLRVCGQQKTGREADERLKHGNAFWRVMHEIMSLSSSVAPGHGIQRRLGEVMEEVHTTHLAVPHRVADMLEENSFDHTVCHITVSNFTQREETERWMQRVSAAAIEGSSNAVYTFDANTMEARETPRHERGSPASYIEIVWDRRNFNYRRRDVEQDFESLRRYFGNGRRTMTLPRGVTAVCFRTLDSFLKNGADYMPFILDLMPPGVPVLHTFRNGEEDHLLIDVLAYKLGVAIGFLELSERAMVRLKSRRPLYTSPLPAFSEIYEAGSFTLPYPATGNGTNTGASFPRMTPPEELRRFARKFMMGSRAGAGEGGYGSSNLGVTRRLDPPGIEGLAASSQSTELEQDVSRATAQLQTDRSQETMSTADVVGGMEGLVLDDGDGQGVQHDRPRGRGRNGSRDRRPYSGRQRDDASSRNSDADTFDGPLRGHRRRRDSPSRGRHRRR